jgi:AraC family transcriptional regulator
MSAKDDRTEFQGRGRHSASSTPPLRTPDASAIWTPEEFAAHLPEAPLVSSLGIVDWDGIEVESRSQEPQELYAPPMTHHLLGLVLGPPSFHFWRDIEGEVKEGLRVPGSTTVIPADRPRRARWDNTANLLHISLRPSLLERVFEPFLANPERIELIPAFSTSDPQIEHIGRALLAELKQGAPGGRLYGESLATALAVHLLGHYTAFPATIPDITHKLVRTEMRRALEYVHDYLDRDLSLQEIAAVSGVSPNYLTSLFKQTTGYSLHQYVIRQRVEKARTLLLRSDLSIGEIALQVGFYDSAHFNRHFKRLTGLTPGILRKDRKNVQKPR